MVYCPYMEKAIFAAGCFWGVEETFRKVPGVTEAYSGYTGGKTENPKYEDVCYNDTGHAEAVEVTYDPAQVKYEDLLKVFFENHNPTTLNMQGPDIGSQYRSGIFFTSDAQKKEAEAYVKELTASGKWKRPIVTEITPASTFYKAEEYHQQYLRKRGLDNCHI